MSEQSTIPPPTPSRNGSSPHLRRLRSGADVDTIRRTMDEAAEERSEQWRSSSGGQWGNFNDPKISTTSIASCAEGNGEAETYDEKDLRSTQTTNDTSSKTSSRLPLWSNVRSAFGVVTGVVSKS